MDENEFTGHVTGEVRWANNGQYCYFMPHLLPFRYEPDPETASAMQDALIRLARLDGIASRLGKEDLAVLAIPFSLGESVSSSSIEGTRSTIEDVLRSEKIAEIDATRARNIAEVLNYRNALDEGYRRMDAGDSITEGLIRDLHRILMSDVRGSDGSPGEFKTYQNAIGRPGDTLETAKLVPSPPESVERLLDNWLEYACSDGIGILEKLALSHYQFEAIHPFRDGNGRMGRLLMMLMLRSEGLLTRPVLYPSRYFDAHRREYIDLLFGVSSRDGIDEWVRFFSKAMSEQAEDSVSMIDALLGYRDRLIMEMDSKNTVRAIPLLFRNPYINAKDIETGIGVSVPTANRVIGELVDKGVVRQIGDRKRGRTYLADGVMEILARRRYQIRPSPAAVRPACRALRGIGLLVVERGAEHPSEV